MIREEISLKSVYRFLGDGTIFTPFGKEVLNAYRIEGVKYKYRYAGHESQNLKTGLTYMKARWMDPETGRFISPDPAKDGLNWFVYAGNNPTTMVDPSGLWDETDAEVYNNSGTGANQAPNTPYIPPTDSSGGGGGGGTTPTPQTPLDRYNEWLRNQPYKIEEWREAAERHSRYLDTWGRLPSDWIQPGE